MHALNFKYDSQYLSDYGFIICDFNYSSGSNIVDTGANLVLNTTSFHNGTIHNMISYHYDDCINIPFDICKNPDIFDDMQISDYEYNNIVKWLNRKSFLKLQFIDDENITDNRYYYATFNVTPIKIREITYGIRLNMKTNSPFAYGEKQLVNLEFTDTNCDRNIVCNTDEEGFIYPKMTIDIKESGTLEIYNELEDRTMRIFGCTAGETITIDYPIISSSIDTHKIQNDFNWVFFRLVSLYNNKINKIRASIPCTIKLEYNPVIKIGI